jgi:FixJ family two-component response regulator
MSSTIPIVFIVDDDISVRESLELLIRDQKWKPEMFASAKEFLDRPRKPVPSCLVLDFISGYGDVPKSVQAMKAGALEFLTKPIDDDALVSAIRNALQRSTQALEQSAEIHKLRERYESLTARERQVMALVVSGLLNKQVAFELSISEITVKAHRAQVMQKMQADSFADLVRMASKLHLVNQSTLLA